MYLYILLGLGIFTGLYLVQDGGQKVATAKKVNPKNMGKLRGTDGIKVSKNFQLNFKKSCEGVLVIAPPGEGKTSSVNIPNLLTDDFPESSIIIGDRKGELFNKTAKYQESIGRKVMVFEPLGGKISYNALANCKKFAEVRYLASNILNNAELALQLEHNRPSGSSEWINMAIPLLTACMLVSKDIPSAVLMIVYNTEEEIFSDILKTGNKEALEQFKLYQSSGKSEKTMASIKSTLLNNVALFIDPELTARIQNNDFTAEMLRKQPIALYVKYSNSTYLAPFLSIFYSQLINQIRDTDGIPVIFNLDEFQNLGRINLIETLALCRDRQMAFILTVQNMARLNTIYGPDNTMTILNSLKTKCVMPSISDTTALKYLSELCGQEQIEIEGIKTKPLFTSHELRTLADGKVLIIAHNKDVFIDEQNTYFKQRKYKNLV